MTTKIDVQPIHRYSPEELTDTFERAIAQLDVQLHQTADAFIMMVHPSVFLKLHTSKLSWRINDTVATYLLKSSGINLTIYSQSRMPTDLVGICTPRSVPVGVDPILVFLGEYPPVYPLEVVLMRGF